MKKRLKTFKAVYKPWLKWVVPAVVLLIGLAGCASLPPAPSPEPLPSPDSLALRLRERQAAIQSYAGQGRLRIKSPGSLYTFDLMVAAVRPDRLRLQAFDFMGRPVLTLITDGREMSLMDYRNSTMYRGAATSENLQRLIPVDLELAQIVTLLSGGQPLSQYVRGDVERKTEMGQEMWRLTLFRPGGDLVERVWLTPPQLRVNRVEVGPAREDAWFQLDFSEYRDVAGLPAPFHIMMADRKAQTEVTVDYEEFRINPPLPETLFLTPLPQGVKVVPFQGKSDEGS